MARKGRFKVATYIHYGHKEFDINKFVAPKSRQWNNKPTGGLWASRTDAKYGWKHWCENKNYDWCDLEQSFTFKVSDNANVIHINCVEDVKKLPDQKTDLDLTYIKTVDFEQLMSDGIDAIEFNISNDWNLYMALYGWDCDSILILNPDIIKMEV
jgi:hypothetical protein